MKKKKQWQDFDLDDCPECGGSVQVFTAAGEGTCFDGDDTRCMDCGCRSCISVDDEDGISWVMDV